MVKASCRVRRLAGCGRRWSVQREEGAQLVFACKINRCVQQQQAAPRLLGVGSALAEQVAAHCTLLGLEGNNVKILALFDLDCRSGVELAPRWTTDFSSFIFLTCQKNADLSRYSRRIN